MGRWPLHGRSTSCACDMSCTARRAYSGGVIESRNIPAPVDKQLEVRWSFGGEKETSATGPQQLSTTFDWLPAKWVRLLRWRDLVNLVQNDSTIRPLLQKREFTLVDDHGQPVSNTP